MAENEEKLSAKEMMKVMKNIEADDKGKSIIGASIETFSMADGKNKKGDIFMTNLEDALEALKLLVDKAIEVANDQKKKKPNKKDKSEKWKFDSVPLKQFGKKMDDVYTSFLLWGLKDAEDDDDSNKEKEKVFNVSKSFRRLESYADWMYEASADLTEPELSPSTMKNAHTQWKLKSSYDKEGHFVWWFDLAEMDLKELKNVTPEESLRYFVWYSHYVMFDEKAQKNGVIFIENLDKLGFWTAMTLVPPKLSAKLDRLTIGVLPVKMKKFYLLEAAKWMSILMALLSPFMSKKMKSRMVNLDKDYDKLVDVVGGSEYMWKGFGKVENGLMTEDKVEVKYFP